MERGGVFPEGLGLSGSWRPNWVGIYRQLRQDRNDAAAYTALAAGVMTWARTDFAEWADREDVVAETCSAVVLGIDKAYGSETFTGFIRGHYFNAKRRIIQRAVGPTVPLKDIDLPVDPASDLTPDEQALLTRCLEQLAARERTAVELKYFADASAEEIGRDLGVSPVNARQIVSRGLAKLRQCVRHAWPQGRG